SRAHTRGHGDLDKQGGRGASEWAVVIYWPNIALLTDSSSRGAWSAMPRFGDWITNPRSWLLEGARHFQRWVHRDTWPRAPVRPPAGVDVGAAALAEAINLGCDGSSLADELDKIGYPLTGGQAVLRRCRPVWWKGDKP